MEDNQIKWSDGLGSRSRSPFLLLIKGDEVFAFKGEDIKGLVVVLGHDYEKNGKWSHTTYRLQLAAGIRSVPGMSGWETGRFVEGLARAVGCKTPDTWTEVAKALDVSVPSAMKFLRVWRPKAAETLDEVETALINLEEASGQETDFETVVVSFGSPNNRAISDGYWEKPKKIPGFEAEIRLKDVSGSWHEGNIEVVGISGKVLSVAHSSGMHGGYYAVSVAVIPGTEVEIPEFKTTFEIGMGASELPNILFKAFLGNEEKIQEFMSKVSKLNISRLDEHEMSCGRARQEAEVIRVSGDKDFFLGADPLEVCSYILDESDVNVEVIPTALGDSSCGNSAFAEALLRARAKKK